MKRGTLLRGLKSLVRLLPIFALLLGACLTDPDADRHVLVITGSVYDSNEQTSALVELFVFTQSEPLATTNAVPVPGPTLDPMFRLETGIARGRWICGGNYRIRATLPDGRRRSTGLSFQTGFLCGLGVNRDTLYHRVIISF